MKTTELIKQAEELLGKCSEGPWIERLDSTNPDHRMVLAKNGIDVVDVRPWPTCEADAAFIVFARNHMQEIIDKLQKHEDALNWIYKRPSFGFGAVPFYVREAARQALEGE